jgi:hypothetical protein
LDNFQNHFGDVELSSITSEDILAFMSKVSDGTKQNTKKLRFTLLSAFFNFIKNSVNPEFLNPCDNPALRKLFKAGKPTQFDILEKDVVDEMIFRTRNPRNRSMRNSMDPSRFSTGVRIVVKKAGELVGIHPWPRPVIPIFINIALIIQSFINGNRFGSSRTRAG